MKTLTISLIGFLLVLNVSGITTFEKNYIRNFRESGNTVRQTADGGYLIAAVSEFSQTYLIRTNPNGDTLWTKLYEGVCHDILEETDGSFVLCGSLSGNALLRKIDSNGTPVWAKSYGGTSEEIAFSLLQTGDGGFMFCGYTQSLGAVFQSVYCVRTNFAGDLIWEKFYSKLYFSEGVRIRELSGGDFLICGNANVISKTPVPNNIILIKINFSGDTLWTRDYIDATGTLATSFAETADNGFIVCGSFGTLPSGNAVSLIKFDSNGGFQWFKTVNLSGNDSRANWIERTIDDNFIVTGTADNNLFVVKADNLGDTLWSRFYSNNILAKGNCIQPTSDGGYVACGQSGSSTTSFSTYLIKTDDVGLITGTDGQNTLNGYPSAFPNPAKERFSIKLDHNHLPVTIELFDMMGGCRLYKKNIESNSITIDVSILSAGIYILRIRKEIQVLSVSKVILIK